MDKVYYAMMTVFLLYLLSMTIGQLKADKKARRGLSLLMLTLTILLSLLLIGSLAMLGKVFILG